ncbi:MAG: hypothetical protein KI790_21000 [Cyclobacteriaceae bacterium]|nr:hypothetical protein [Cyclobacteriaceae bacterium HetDA_MAG_MS6]
MKSGFRNGDTWYPSWASNDTLYSPWTDGYAERIDGYTDISRSWDGPSHNTTGQGVIIGDDPLHLESYSIGIYRAESKPYHGRYPSGSLVHNGVWYYGTYCLDPTGQAKYGDQTINWPWLGPFVGFRYSKDYGRKWVSCPHTPEEPIFKENGQNGYPVKIGAPHFVDFGKNMEYSPDGKAYLVAHGSDITDTKWRFWNNSWITGDQIYLLRVTPSIENINDPTQYEFYAGRSKQGQPIWTNDFDQIQPLLKWNNNMGCVTITYNAPLGNKYLMCVTDGGNTASKMNTYILEAEDLTGEWHLVTYLKDFGEQAYFVNFPSKFISEDGMTAWLLYSGNFATDWNGEQIEENPPGSHYGMVFQKVELLSQKGKRP